MSPRRFAPALLGKLVAACLVTACAGAPPPPPVVHLDVTPPPAPVPPPSPARWVESGGTTLLGPLLPGGTLVLLGGRRAVIHPDGSLETEKTPAPEPLVELVEIPVQAGTRLVGRGASGVYRFDDPLGAPVVLARSGGPFALARLGAGPGVVAVWASASDLPRFLDVETGREQKLAGLPEPPLRALAFVDERRGAAIFEAVGLAVTTDGGASWRLAAESAPGDALRVSGLRRRGGSARAFAYADGPDGEVDLDRARLGALDPPRPPAAEAPLLRWIRATSRDPLEAVASGGLELPAGGALVASHGLLARVDPRSGEITELHDIARSKWVSPCGAGRAGRTAWVACALADDAGRDLFDPFGVIEVPLTMGASPPSPRSGLATNKAALVRNGEAELRVSPSGGVLLLAPCSNEEMGSACVRQPDGKWKTISVDGDLAERAAGALADGRVAFLRGMFEGDDASEPASDDGSAVPRAPSAAAPAPAPSGDDEGAHAKHLHVSTVGPDGKEHALEPIGFALSRGYVRAQSPIEEDLDHTLRFVIEDGEGPFAVVVPPGSESPQVHRIPDAVAARLHAGRGIAVGEGRVLASLDGGATWSEVPATPPVLEAASAAAASYDDPGQLAVSEVGAKIGPMLRLGWGTADAAPAASSAPPAGAPPSLLTPVAPAPSSATQVLACTSEGPLAGTPPLNGNADIRQLLAGKPVKTPGTRHESTTWSSSHAGMLDTVALLDEEGPEARGSAPVKWTFRWHDPREIGGTVHRASLPAPKGATWSTSLRFAGASGGRAIFAVRSGNQLRLVRVKPGGGAEVTSSDLVPALNDVTFGEGRSEVIAWIRDTQVIAWPPGERPRAIARIGSHATRVLGAPTPAGVPLLLGASDWSLQRTLPIPQLDRARPDVDPPSAAPSLDGWTRVAPLPSHLEGLPVCPPRAAGPRFTVTRLSLRAAVDEVPESGVQAIYDVRLEGGQACVAGVTATLASDRSGAKKLPVTPAGKAPKGPAGAVAFVRVDLTGKHAEGGERGLPPATMRRLRCRLEPQP